MYNKYVLFIPQGGINDCFSNIISTISYCETNKRTLLLDMTNSIYKINFSDFFSITNFNCDIIYDTNQIKNILLSLEDNNCLTVHPHNIDFKLIDLFQKVNKIKFNYKMNVKYFVYKNIPLDLPDNVNETVILHSRCGGGKGFLFFKNLLLRNNVKNVIKQKLQLLNDNYLCIQVRNTDLQCDYIKLYENNKEYIHSFNTIYICTDNKLVYDFFKFKINVFCFTNFPNKMNVPIHTDENIDPTQKMFDLLTDIFIATNSVSILSNSKGGFIKLLRDCHKNKKDILNLLL